MIGAKSGLKIHKKFVEIVKKITDKLINKHSFFNSYCPFLGIYPHAKSES
jgi:hypothetical protein